MHIPEYSQTVSPLYLVTRKKNDLLWFPEQQQAFEEIEQEMAHAVALGPVSPETFKALESFEARSDDIILAGYPKSESTGLKATSPMIKSNP
ncbi:hypothetical protein WISP_102321 [Willisornis vidua]|uniref:Uncharacterized protein n=1 Tax=Willisornis vidua TaxID=1566151 RepID=A0ABQ9CY60_9PASS|nr:hypothetical protein WISP_102321 [Willisornis vidua]